MRTRLLSTVAATLLIGAGAASAQTMNKDQAPTRAPAAQQNAPAEKVSPPMNAGERKAPETSGQATPDTKPGAGPGPTTGQSAPKEMNKDMPKSGVGGKADVNGSGKAGDSKASGSTANDMKAGDKPATKSSEGASPNAAPNRSAGDNKATDSKSSTTGQGAAAGQAKLSTEQRTKITTVIKSQKVERVEPSQLKVSINIGARIPSSVRVHRLPAEVVTIYPEWRGYDYILVADQIIIIDPRTHEIVFILEA